MDSERAMGNLLYWQVNDRWLSALQGFSALSVLELGSCFAITDEALKACLLNMRSLRVIDLDRCKRLTDYGLSPIGA